MRARLEGNLNSRALRSREMEIAFLSNAAFSSDLLAEEAAKELMGSFVGYWFGKY